MSDDALTPQRRQADRASPFDPAPRAMRSPLRLAHVTAGALAALAVAELVCRVLSVHMYLMYERIEHEYPGGIDAPSYELATLDVAIILLINLVGRMVVAVPFLWWLWRVRSNLGAVGARYHRHWAADAWFIPFLSFVLPLLVVAQVDRVSEERAARAMGRPVTGRGRRWLLLGAWWAGFHLHPVIGFFGVWPSAEDWGLSAIVGIQGVLAVVVTGAIGLAIAIVLRITRNQEQVLQAASPTPGGTQIDCI